MTSFGKKSSNQHRTNSNGLAFVSSHALIFHHHVENHEWEKSLFSSSQSVGRFSFSILLIFPFLFATLPSAVKFMRLRMLREKKRFRGADFHVELRVAFYVRCSWLCKCTTVVKGAKASQTLEIVAHFDEEKIRAHFLLCTTLIFVAFRDSPLSTAYQAFFYGARVPNDTGRHFFSRLTRTFFFASSLSLLPTAGKPRTCFQRLCAMCKSAFTSPCTNLNAAQLHRKR